jgi:RNA polymerase sigma factor (sigma-70 family)
MPRPHLPAHPDERELLHLAFPIIERFARRAWRRLGRRVDFDDLFAVGCLGALDAVRRFDAGRARFAPYIIQRIRWTFMTEMRRHARRAKHADRIADISNAPADPERRLARKRARKLVMLALNSLDEQARTIVNRHHLGDHSVERIAADLGISRRTAERLRRHALADMRRRLQRSGQMDELAETLPCEEW